MSTENSKKNKRKSRRWRMRQRKRMPINIAASVITAIALYCGLESIFDSIRGQYRDASYWIIAAIFFDTLDGIVARMTKSVSDFGKELDSLSDVVSFGVAPSVLIYTAYVQNGGMNEIESRIISVIAIVFVILGALRLARYNVFQSDRQDIFVGLPIPSAAGNVASLTLFCNYFEYQISGWMFITFTITLALLMVSNVRYPKKNLSVFLLTPRKGFQTLVGFVMLIAAFNIVKSYSPDIVFLPLGMTYVFFGITNEFLAFITRRKPLNTPASEPITKTAVSDT